MTGECARAASSTGEGDRVRLLPGEELIRRPEGVAARESEEHPPRP